MDKMRPELTKVLSVTEQIKNAMTVKNVADLYRDNPASNIDDTKQFQAAKARILDIVTQYGQEIANLPPEKKQDALNECFADLSTLDKMSLFGPSDKGAMINKLKQIADQK